MTKIVKLRGFGRADIKIFERLGKRKIPFALGPLRGRWFLQTFRYQTDSAFYEPFSYTAEFIQAVKITKPKKRKSHARS